MGSKTAQKGYQDLFVRELDSLCHTCSVLGHYNGLKDWYFQDVTFFKTLYYMYGSNEAQTSFPLQCADKSILVANIFNLAQQPGCMSPSHFISLALTSLFVHLHNLFKLVQGFT